VRWRAALASSDVKSVAHVALYDPSGLVTGGAPGYVPKSDLWTSNVEPSLCEVELTSELVVLRSGLLIVHLFAEQAQAQSESTAFALWAALDLE